MWKHTMIWLTPANSTCIEKFNKVKLLTHFVKKHKRLEADSKTVYKGK